MDDGAQMFQDRRRVEMDRLGFSSSQQEIRMDAGCLGWDARV